jgi:hypothetical protein
LNNSNPLLTSLADGTISYDEYIAATESTDFVERFKILKRVSQIRMDDLANQAQVGDKLSSRMGGMIGSTIKSAASTVKRQFDSIRSIGSRLGSMNEEMREEATEDASNASNIGGYQRSRGGSSGSLQGDLSPLELHLIEMLRAEHPTSSSNTDNISSSNSGIAPRRSRQSTNHAHFDATYGDGLMNSHRTSIDFDSNTPNSTSLNVNDDSSSPLIQSSSNCK